MKYRKLGETGISVSEISFGTIPILKGNIPVLPNYYNLHDDAATEVMKHAYNLGCNLYDTAIVPEYGDAEIKLGKFSKIIGRENIIISDKARFFYGDEMYDAVLESCENLQTYPDIYFVHQVDTKNADVTFGKFGALDALADLKKQGIIKFVGIASHYYDILLRGAKDARVDVLQGSGNILERGMLDRIENERDLFLKKGFLVNKVYAAGILPRFFSEKVLTDGVLSYPISTALIGLGTISEVDAAMKNLSDDYNRPTFKDVLYKLEKNFIPIPCDRCQKCECIYGFEIHILLRQFNYYQLGKDYWALRKLDMSIADLRSKCEKCTVQSCMSGCEKNIDIPNEINKIKNLVDAFVRNSWI